MHQGSDEVTHALVDVQGDAEYVHSTWHSANGGEYRDPADLQALVDRIATMDPATTDLESIIQQARALSNACAAAIPT
ncbi:hypothetical protein [Azospirillum griseum]|uniref:Uncharacterized protein n=1 Tax=Azospirillum griseum TaxID=2496639 RepID=A0A431V9W4_9PROT|nr:hypothetical protein [Azospirillum griseum]RTR12778.1 hypothetical protein EJ903_25205 [Azospirillum griseum]